MGSISRRDFIGGAGALGAAMAAGATSSALASEKASTASAKADSAAGDATTAQTAVSGFATADLHNADPIAPAPVPDSWDEECDVLVVGLGGGGLVAAGYLAQNGLKVIGIDKDGITGGATRHAGTICSMYGGSKDQEAMGYGFPAYPLDLNAFVRKYEEEHQYSVNEDLVRSIALAGGPCMDWVMAQDGITLVCVGLGYVDAAVAQGEQNNVMGLNNTMNELEAVARNAGADIRTLTQCMQLVMDGDAVVGAIIEDSDGKDLSVKANQAVLFCAGGIGMNPDLIAKYEPSVAGYITSGGPMPTHTGEAFRMGLGAGADVSGFNAWCAWECALDESTKGGDGKFFHYFWNGARQMFHNPWLILNERCERMPYFATGVQPDLTFGTEIQMGDMCNNAQWAATPNQRVYSICDSHYADVIFNMKVFPGQGDASRIPLTDDSLIIPEAKNFVSGDWQSEVQEAIDRGAIKKADTLEELAEQLGLDPKGVQDAVNHWNEICASGTDTEMAWPYDASWLNPVKDGPFYGAILGGQMGKTGVGLRVDSNLQVMRKDGSLIPGLYANFSTAGGFDGESTYSELWNGGINGGAGTSIISGFRAAESILEQSKK